MKISNKQGSETRSTSTLSSNYSHERPTLINTKLDKDLYDNIFHDYYELRLHAKDLAIKYNMSFKKIKYEMYKSGFTQANYLRFKYSKEFLINKLKTLTYEEVAKELNLTYGEFRILVQNHNIKRDTHEHYKVNRVNPEFYINDKYSKEFNYFLGLFITDGCFKGKNSMAIVIKNKGAKELLNKLAKIGGHTNVRKYGEFYSLIFNDRGLKNKLLSLGIPEKGKTYNLMNFVFPTNKEDLYCLLCGMLDGDGHIGFQKSKFGYRVALKYAICNYSEDFLSKLGNYIQQTLGFDSSLYIPKDLYPENKTGKAISSLEIGVRQGSKEFFKNMYNISPIYLKCKYEIYQNVMKKVMI